MCECVNLVCVCVSVYEHTWVWVGEEEGVYVRVCVHSSVRVWSRVVGVNVTPCKIIVRRRMIFYKHDFMERTLH